MICILSKEKCNYCNNGECTNKEKCPYKYDGNNIEDSNVELWSWSIDGNWNRGLFKTREEVIEDVIENIDNIKWGTATIEIGKCKFIPPETKFDAYNVFNKLDNNNYIYYNGFKRKQIYVYKNINDEDKKWLEDEITKLIIEFHKRVKLKPCLFNVTETELINLFDLAKKIYNTEK